MLPSSEPEKEEKKAEASVDTDKKKKIMVLWDFDWSLINANSDFYVGTKLYGREKYYNEIYANLEAEAAKKDVTVFTDVMDQFVWPTLFKAHQLNKESFAKLLCDVPVFQENIHIVQTLGNDTNKELTEQYVVSDANTVLIETILEHHKLFPHIIPSQNIYTNPGWYDTETGMLRCKRYHTAENPHNCALKDSLNICKGKILDEEIMKGKQAADITRIYIGDGGGDYCPVTRLSEGDFAFVRKYDKVRGLERKIAKDDGIKLKCTVMTWKDGKELLECFQKALPAIKF